MISDLSKVEIKKIAILRALQLGDMLCIIPAVRALKKTYPDASLTLIGLPWQVNFVKRFSHYFSNFIEFPGWPGLPEREYNSSEVVRFLLTMQQHQFDLVLQMQDDGYIANPMCMLFGAKAVAGFRKVNDFCPDEKLFPILKDTDHEIIRFLKLAEVVNAPPWEIDLEFPILEDEILNFQRIRDQLKLPQNYICVHPGARESRRRWSPKNFAFVADALAARDFAILLTGSIEERAILEMVGTHMRYPSINLVRECGHVGVGELGALVKNSAGLISNDTGISHIAAALKIPSVIIFSEFSDPQRWAPLNKKLHTPMLGVETYNPQKVVDAMLKHLQNHLTVYRDRMFLVRP